MCKVNGHSIFSYMFQPVWNWKKLNNSKKKKQTAEELVPEPQKVSEAEQLQDTLDTVSTKKTDKRTLSSLRVNKPITPQSSFVNNGGTTSMGLNIPQ